MIYVFLGNDFKIINNQINDLIFKLNINNIIKYDFNESSIVEILNEVNYVDLFNEQKLIIVSNFSFKKIKESDEKNIIKYIDNMNDNIIVLKCIDESLDDRKKITKELKNKCKVIEIEKLDYKNLHEYVSNMLKNAGINSNFYQVKKILDLCEYNPDYTINEVEKLLLYKIGEAELTDDDIEKVISKNNEKEMFNLIDYILNKDIKNCLISYKSLLESNIDPIIIIDNIAKNFRLLIQIKELKGKMSEIDLVKLLKVNPYTIKKLYPYINNYSDDDIINILYKLSDIDINIKIKGMDKEKLLESFFISL